MTIKIRTKWKAFISIREVFNVKLGQVIMAGFSVAMHCMISCKQVRPEPSQSKNTIDRNDINGDGKFQAINFMTRVHRKCDNSRQVRRDQSDNRVPKAQVLVYRQCLGSPHLECCGPLWAPNTKLSKRKLEAQQISITKKNRGMFGLSY